MTMSKGADIEYFNNGLFISFMPCSKAGEAAFNEIASMTDGTGSVLSIHGASTIKQLRAAGYSVHKDVWSVSNAHNEEAMTMSIKSITTVNTTAGWAVRQRNTDGSELFIVCDPETGQRYTLHQAQYAADSLTRHLAGGGDTYAEPLPSGVRVVK